MSSLWKRLAGNGPVLILLSSAFFALMALSAKAAAPLPSAETGFFRFLLGIVIMFSLHATGLLPIAFHNRPLLALRGVLAGTAVLCYFGAIEHIQVGTATLFQNTFPFFALLVAVLVGQERVQLKVLGTLAFALGGIFLVLAPKVGSVPFGLGPVLGLSSGLFAGASFVVIRELRRTDEAAAIYTAMCMAGCVVSLPMALLDVRLPDARQWGWLVVLAVSSTAGQLLMNHGMRYLSATAGSIIAVATTAFAALLGHLVFGESYGWSFFAGAALIFGAALYIATRGSGHEGLLSDARADAHAEAGPPE